MTVIIDYGVGNLFSLKSSLAYIGVEAEVSGDETVIEKADRIVLPGVGAFGDAARLLAKDGLDKVVKSEATKGKPLLGICLAMQLLFDKSYEYGETDGLSMIKGTVNPIESIIPKEYKIPHIGWNALAFSPEGKKSEIFKYINEGDYVYFVHSFAAVGCEDSIIAMTDYGVPLTVAVAKDNVYGMQFHPEKSGEVGLNILKAFCKM